jgi:hypothetical protein
MAGVKEKVKILLDIDRVLKTPELPVSMRSSSHR